MFAFTALPNAILARQDLTISEFRTYAALASFASPSNPVCWPSRESIAERLGGVHVDTVTRALTRLKRLGLIEIKRRCNRSSVYRLLTGEPPGSDTHPSDPVPTPACRIEQTKEQTKKNPLTPVPGGSVSTSLTVEAQPAPVVEPEPPQASVPATTDRRQAAVRVIDHLNRTTNQHLPTDGATARLVRRRLGRHTEQDLIAVIDHKRQQWKGTELERHLTPRTLFRPTALEGYLSEVRQAQEQRQKRLERERQHIEQIRPEPSKATPERAMRGLAALKAALGMRDKAADGSNGMMA